jgi:hypothetical protein
LASSENESVLVIDMFLDSDVAKFKICGKTLLLISEEICYGRNTIADFENQLYYLGSDQQTISTAIHAWQTLNNRELTNDELRQTLIDNGHMSEAV